MLHLRCGTDILDSLDAAGVPGRKAAWADPLCEGPWPALDRALVRPMRARHLAERYQRGFMATLADLVAADESLDAAAAEDEVVLWFEHDLYDQAILAWLLDRLAPLAPRVRLSLVQVHEHPGIRRFIGLGQLDAAALGALFAARAPVSGAQLALASRAVAAWTADEPHALARLRTGATALPHLAPAIERYLAEYPGVRDGLAASERLALEAIAGGAGTASAAFVAVQAREPRPWMGDAMLVARLRSLAEGVNPLLAVEGEWGLELDGDPRLALTPLGRRVLAGEADAWAIRPQERWMGGVHLRPGGVDWRWNGERIVRGRGAP
jgi:hypothetical protein